jgi:translation initiation factor 2-alpha kinase 4
LQDSDLDDEAWNDEGSDSGSSNALSYVSDMLDDAARNKKRDLILVFLFHLFLFISNETFSSLLFKRIYA